MKACGIQMKASHPSASEVAKRSALLGLKICHSYFIYSLLRAISRFLPAIIMVLWCCIVLSLSEAEPRDSGCISM